MNIGTAVPSVAELEAVTHHFIQNKSIQDVYTVGDFERDAILKMDALFETNDYAIVVGGSGLYVDALLYGLDVFPTISSEVRHGLIKQYEEQGIAFLQDKLKQLDPTYYQHLAAENPQTIQNQQRLLRFVEVCIGSGKPYSSFLKKHKTKRNFNPIIIGLEANRDVLYARIEKRVDIMIGNGLLNEVQSLQSFQVLNALQTVGYKEIFAYLANECSLENAITEIKKNTRRYAKRQLTWFKRYKNVQWFDFETNTATVIETINVKSL